MSAKRNIPASESSYTKSALTWWPGGIPARVWADRFMLRECTREDVPEALHGLVREHVDTANAFRRYERRKQEWAATHPEALPAEYQRAVRQIADEEGV